MGRNAKPDALHEIEGTKSKATKAEVAVPESLQGLPVTAPEYLSDSAATAYEVTVSELSGLGLLARCDFAVVEAYAVAYGLLVDATRAVAQYGVLIPSARGDGDMVKNPALSVVNAQQSQVRALAARLGCDPVSRAGMALDYQEMERRRQSPTSDIEALMSIYLQEDENDG